MARAVLWELDQGLLCRLGQGYAIYGGVVSEVAASQKDTEA